MKKLLFNIFKSMFKEEMNSIAKKKALDISLEKRRKKNLINYPIDTKVIIVSNEPEDNLTIAKVVDHQKVSKQEIIEPVFYNEEIGEFLSMGIIHIWSQEKEDALKKLSWDERYNVSTTGLGHLSKEDIKRKNSFEYKNRNKRN